MQRSSANHLKFLVRLPLQVSLIYIGTLSASSPPAGSHVQLDMQSTVGILLDEIPAGTLREQAAAEAAQHDDAFWTAKAQRQVRLANYRLVFRRFFYKAP